MQTYCKSAMDWLVSVQNPDGGWGPFGTERTSSTVTNTAEVLSALCEFRERGVHFEALALSAEYLCVKFGQPNGGPYSLLRHYAWSAWALLKYDPSKYKSIIDAMLRWIRDNRHTSGGWSHSTKSAACAAVFPTFLAVRVLILAAELGFDADRNRNHAQNGVSWLKRIAVDTGDATAWGYYDGAPASVAATAFAVLALQSFDCNGEKSLLSRGDCFILSSLKNDNYWPEEIEHGQADAEKGRGLPHDFRHFTTAWALRAVCERNSVADNRICLALLSVFNTEPGSSLEPLSTERAPWSVAHAISTVEAINQSRCADLAVAIRALATQLEKSDGLERVNSNLLGRLDSLSAKDSHYRLGIGDLWIHFSSKMYWAIALAYSVGSLGVFYFYRRVAGVDRLHLQIYSVVAISLFGGFVALHFFQRERQSLASSVCIAVGALGYMLSVATIFI